MEYLEFDREKIFQLAENTIFFDRNGTLVYLAKGNILNFLDISRRYKLYAANDKTNHLLEIKRKIFALTKTFKVFSHTGELMFVAKMKIQPGLLERGRAHIYSPAGEYKIECDWQKLDRFDFQIFSPDGRRIIVVESDAEGAKGISISIDTTQIARESAAALVLAVWCVL